MRSLVRPNAHAPAESRLLVSRFYPQHRSVGEREFVETEESAAGRAGYDLQPIGLAKGDPAQQCFKRLAADGPVGPGGHGQDAADQQLRRHGPGFPIGPRQQHLIRLIVGGKDDRRR